MRSPVQNSPASTHCATACCRVTPCCPGKMPTNIMRSWQRWWPNMLHRDPPRNIWSRKSPALWRKRRLRLAEAAAHRRGLEETLESYRETVKVALVHLGATAADTQEDMADMDERVVDAIRATAADTQEDMADMAADEAMTRRALELLGSKRNDAYEAGLAALRKDTQPLWADRLARDPDKLGEDEQPKPATADVEGLRRFLEGEVLPWFDNRRKELVNRPLIREQAFGEALDPDKLERLGRYEIHLDRKLERMLAMLLRLKDLRREPVES